MALLSALESVYNGPKSWSNCRIRTIRSRLRHRTSEYWCSSWSVVGYRTWFARFRCTRISRTRCRWRRVSGYVTVEVCFWRPQRSEAIKLYPLIYNPTSTTTEGVTESAREAVCRRFWTHRHGISVQKWNFGLNTSLKTSKSFSYATRESPMLRKSAYLYRCRCSVSVFRAWLRLHAQTGFLCWLGADSKKSEWKRNSVTKRLYCEVGFYVKLKWCWTKKP